MHPLSLRGYRSVGDEGLTTMDSRHLGLFRECGLHPFIKEQRA
jgi:hypothetical protein